MWLLFSFISALLLGIYDVAKKTSLHQNAVIPVLQTSILISSLILTPFLILSRFYPGFENSIFFVPTIEFHMHLKLILKAVIVLTSWLFAYFAIKHLPITRYNPLQGWRFSTRLRIISGWYSLSKRCIWIIQTVVISMF